MIIKNVYSAVENNTERHKIFTEEVNKFALSADDDKRIILSDKIRTLAHGHYKL